MPRRSLWLLLVACAPKAPEPGSTDSTGAPDSTTEPTGGTTGPGDHIPVDCSIAPQSHAEACPNEPCAITVDVEFRCDDYNFAAPGLRVAIGPDLAWLATSSEADAMLFSADPGGAQRLDVFPSRFVREVITLATDPAGGLHAMAAVGPVYGQGGDELAPRATLHVDPDGVAHEVEGGAVILLGFDVDDAAALRAWTTEYPEVFREGVAVDGQWSWTPAEVPSANWTRFGLTREDATLAAGITGDYNNWKLRITVDGVTQQLGTGWGSEWPGTYVLSAPVPKAAAAGPALAAALQYTDALRVTWPSDDSYQIVAIPDTSPLERTCTYAGGDPPNCAGPCHETAAGLEDRAFALAVTDDGAGWLVHVTSHLDQQVTFAPVPVGDFEEACLGTVASDASIGILHLTKIDFALREATEVLTQPIGRVDLDDLFVDLNTTPPLAVDVRAHGTSLAIGVRTTGSAVRLLRIETAAL